MSRWWRDRENLEATAIENAYAAHIGRLTTVLCEGVGAAASGDLEDVVSRFRAGLLAARAAYEAATKAFEESNS